jgi:hypothetical protein
MLAAEGLGKTRDDVGDTRSLVRALRHEAIDRDDHVCRVGVLSNVEESDPEAQSMGAGTFTCDLRGE